MTNETNVHTTESGHFPKTSGLVGGAALAGELATDNYDDVVSIANNLQDSLSALEYTLRTAPSPAAVSQYASAALRTNRFMIEAANKFPGTRIDNNKRSRPSEAVEAAIVNPVLGSPVEASIIRHAFEYEEASGGLHDLIRTFLDDYPTFDSSRMKLLTQAYGVANYPELFAKLDIDDPFDSEVRSRLLEPQRLKEMCYSQRPAVPIGSSSTQYREANQAFFDAIAGGIFPSISAEFREALAYANTRRVGKDSELFSAAVAQVERIGPEKAQRLYEVCGSTMFGCYSDSQIDLLYSVFLDQNKSVIERLRTTNVRIVVVNAAGDNSGVLNDVPMQYEDSENATIFFEVHSFKGIYNSFAKMRTVGIQPSSAVFAQHSAEGQMNLFQRSKSGKRGHGQGMFVASAAYVDSIKDMMKEQDAEAFSFERDGLGFKRLIDQYMKPSTVTGFKQVILHGCEMGKHMRKKVHENEPIDKTDTSVALVFSGIIAGVAARVRLYAFGQSMTLHKTHDGLTATKPAESSEDTAFDMVSTRQAFEATFIEIADGVIDEKAVKLVPLQK